MEALDNEFGSLEPALTGLRLIRPGISQADLAKLESMLCAILPAAFASAVCEFNLGSLTIGPTVFGHESDYTSVLQTANIDSAVPWWGEGARPTPLVMFANSDPFVLAIDCEGGRVLALRHGEGLDRAVKVAADFNLFLRGIGTVFVVRRAEPGQGALQVGPWVGSLVGSSPEGIAYWSQLAS